MGKSRRVYANTAMTLIGSFITSPNAKLYECGYEWRHMTNGVERKHMKRELRKFRRADGKRRINEATAFILEDEATTSAEEQARLDQELYGAFCECGCDDDPRSCGYSYGNNQPDDDGECLCCRPDDYWQHEDYDYWAAYDDRIWDSEADYQREMAYLDWGYEAHQQALQAAYERGVRDGYQQAQRAC